MGNKIEVGEYIRTYDGIIGKILEDEDIGENGVCINKTFFAIYEDIKKHSFNIINLIEEGDYVNGCKVLNKNKTILTLITEFGVIEYKIKDIKIEQIKTIVTKEMFKNVEYKI